MADLVVSEGYAALGYEYINVDDCWLEKSRGPRGELVADRRRFASGMKALADYVHAKGLKFGIYEDYGNYTCAGYPGILGFSQNDAAQFASWDVDYVKLDGCYSLPIDMDHGYPEFGRNLNATGRHMVYSCSWPVYQIYAGMNVSVSCGLIAPSRSLIDSVLLIAAQLLVDHPALQPVEKLRRHPGLVGLAGEHHRLLR